MFSTAAGGCIASACADARIEDNSLFRDGTGTPDAIAMAVKVPSRTNRGYTVRCNGNKIRTDGASITYTGQAVTGGPGTMSLLEVSGNYANYTGTNNIAVEVGTAATCPPITDLVVSRNNMAGALAVTSGNASSTVALMRLWQNASQGVTVTGTTNSIATAMVEGSVVAGTLTIGSGVVNARADAVRCTSGVVIDEATTIELSRVTAPVSCEIDNTTQEFTSCMVTGCRFDLSGTGHGLEIDASDATRSLATANYTGLSNPTYSVTNLTTDRTYDADTALVTETNDVLGTLIGDLRTRGHVL
jgi:hypothetical protein